MFSTNRHKVTLLPGYLDIHVSCKPNYTHSSYPWNTQNHELHTHLVLQTTLIAYTYSLSTSKASIQPPQQTPHYQYKYLNNSHHNITICKVRAHVNISSNDVVDKLAKQGAKKPCILDTPFHLIRHQTLYWSSIPPTSTQHDGLIHHTKPSIDKNMKLHLYHTSKTQSQLPINGCLTLTSTLPSQTYFGMPHGLPMHKSRKFLTSMLAII